MKQPFNTQEECLLYFEKLRWNKKITCPYCFSNKTHKAKSEPGRHFCYHCVSSFSVLAGTIFEDTRLPLSTWMAVINAVLKSKIIIPAQTLSESFGITIKTAWLTAMKIRCAMIDDETNLHLLFSAKNNNSACAKTKGNKLSKYVSDGEIKQAGIQKISFNHQHKNDGEPTSVKLIDVLKQYIRHDKNSPATVRSYEAMDKTIEQIYHQQTALQKGSEKQSLGDDRMFIKHGIDAENKVVSAKYLPFYLLEHEYKEKRRGKKNKFSQFMKSVFSQPATSLPVSKAVTKKRLAYA